MTSSHSWSSFSGIMQAFQRIKAIDNRIDSIEGKSPEADETMETGSKEVVNNNQQQSSFARVFGEIRSNLPPRASRWIVEDALQKASQATGMDIDLIKAVVQNESGGNSSALSSAGAKGLMQLIDPTAASLGVTDSFDPHQNALGGAKYLKSQLQRFGGNLSLALAAYNAGPEAVAKYSGIPPYPETMKYVKNVEATYRGLKQKTLGSINQYSDMAEHFNFDSDLKLS